MYNQKLIFLLGHSKGGITQFEFNIIARAAWSGIELVIIYFY